jgi:superfamily II RNA helicase
MLARRIFSNRSFAFLSTSSTRLDNSIAKHIGRVESGFVKKPKLKSGQKTKTKVSPLPQNQEVQTWESAGIHVEFARLLRNEFPYLRDPIGVQAHAIQYILTGRSAIIADQCGSGKTVIFIF